MISPKKIPSTPKKRKEKVTVLSPSPDVNASKNAPNSGNPRQKRRLTKSRKCTNKEIEFNVKDFTSFEFPPELVVVSI